MRLREGRAPVSSRCVSGSVVIALGVSLMACGKGDNAARDTADADTAQMSLAPDTATAPRVVPYDPSSPGAMRSGDQPIRASGTGGVDSVKTRPTTPRTPAPSTSAANMPTSSTEVDSVGDPVTVVRDYYAAIRGRDFLRAYRMWETSGQRNLRGFAQFEAGFDSTESVEVRTGAPGRVEGAAGSRYVTVPVEIDSRLRDGTRQKFSGTYTLRRVVVPGASAAQRRWHLYSANIRQVQ